MSNPTNFSEDNLQTIISHLNEKYTADSVREAAEKELKNRGYNRADIDYLKYKANENN